MIDLFQKTCNELKENLPAIAVSSTGVGFLTPRVLTKIVEQPANYTITAAKHGQVQLPMRGRLQAAPIAALAVRANSRSSMADLRAEG